MKFYTSVVEQGDSLLVRGYENGRAISRRVNYEPYLFVPSREVKPKWRDMHGVGLAQMHFDSISDMKAYVKTYDNVDNFRLYGMTKPIYPFLNEEYPGELDYDPELIRVAYIDIEVDSVNGFASPESPTEPVTAITLKLDGYYRVFSAGKYTPHRPDVIYTKSRDEREMLLAFVNYWHSNPPDVISGWNINFYDIPYLINRIKMVLGDSFVNQLSPWKRVYTRDVEQNFFGIAQKRLSGTIVGIAQLDYIDLYKKFTYTQQESYKLDNIAHVELDECKIDFSEYGNLRNLYREDFQKFIEYNVKDVELVYRLEDKMRLIELVYAAAFDAKVNFSDVLSQVRTWDAIIHNHLFAKNIAIPFASDNSKMEAFEGAYVKDPKVGVHDWVVSVDLNSLYPHLIMQYNISPETILDKQLNFTVDDILNGKVFMHEENEIIAPNGWCFKKDKKGFLPELMEKMYNNRVLYKKKMLEAKAAMEAETSPVRKADLKKAISRYDNLQKAMKIQLNSAYGAVGSKFFRYFDLRQATAITSGGQLAIRWAEQEINGFLNRAIRKAYPGHTHDKDYIIAADTDSLYINFGDTIKYLMPRDYSAFNRDTQLIIDWIDKVGKEVLEPQFERIYNKLAIRMNSFQKMSMKRECIADRGIWTAKKRYILNVWDEEGVRYKEPKLKIMGMEAIKSSTPYACRKAIKECYKLIIDGNESKVQEYIAKFREEFNKLPFDEIAFPRGMDGLNKYKLNDKSVPIHVRGALSFNEMLINKKLTKKYELIRDGEKIKFCYLRLPNPSKQNVISVATVLPPELGLHEMIDYKTQFDKAFLQPITTILDILGWSAEKRNTVMDLWS